MKKWFAICAVAALALAFIVPRTARAEYFAPGQEERLEDYNLTYKTTTVSVGEEVGEETARKVNSELQHAAFDNLASVNAQANTLAYTDQRAEGSYTQEITRQTPAFVSVRCARRFSVEGRPVYSDATGAVYSITTGERLALGDLFTDSSDYLSIVKNEMERQLDHPAGLEDDQPFYLTDTQLVVLCKAGEQESMQRQEHEVNIPLERLQGLLKEEYR